jgi:hypothetical protein
MGAFSAGVDAKGRVIGSKLKPIDGIKDIDGNQAYTLTLAAFIPGEDDVTRVLDGRYHTVSIGIISNKVTCSICGTNIAEDYCGHMKGRSYEIERNGKNVKEMCYWLINHTEAVEVSFVNEPADQSAQIVGVRSTVGSDEKLPSALTRSESVSNLFVLTGNDVIPAVEEESESATAVAISLKEAWEQAQSKLAKENKPLDNKDQFLTIEELADLSLPGLEEETKADETLAESESEQPAAEESSETLSEGESTEEENSSEDLLDAVEVSHGIENDIENTEGTIKESAEEKPAEEITESTEVDESAVLQEKISDLETQLTQLQETIDSSKSELDIFKEQNTRLRSALSRMLAEYLTDAQLFVGDTTSAKYEERYESNLNSVKEQPSKVLQEIHSMRETELARVNKVQENEIPSADVEEKARISAEQVLQSALRERKAGIRSKTTTNL